MQRGPPFLWLPHPACARCFIRAFFFIKWHSLSTSLHLAQKLCVTDDFFPMVFCRNKVEFHLAICCVPSSPDHLHSIIVAFAYYIPPPPSPWCYFLLHVTSGPRPPADRVAGKQDVPLAPCAVPFAFIYVCSADTPATSPGLCRLLTDENKNNFPLEKNYHLNILWRGRGIHTLSSDLRGTHGDPSPATSQGHLCCDPVCPSRPLWFLGVYYGYVYPQK